jgi:hypothetical protein
MKLIKYFISILILFAIFSCSKYEDGPLISLRSKKARLLGEWKVVEFMKDEEDLTHFYLDTCGCTIQFVFDEVTTQGKTDNYFFINCPYNSWNYINPDANIVRNDYMLSTWAFSSNKEKIWLNIGRNNDSRYKWGVYPLTICRSCYYPLEIIKLQNNKLWVKYKDIENSYVIKFEKI